MCSQIFNLEFFLIWDNCKKNHSSHFPLAHVGIGLLIKLLYFEWHYFIIIYTIIYNDNNSYYILMLYWVHVKECILNSQIPKSCPTINFSIRIGIQSNTTWETFPLGKYTLWNIFSTIEIPFNHQFFLRGNSEHKVLVSDSWCCSLSELIFFHPCFLQTG